MYLFVVTCTLGIIIKNYCQIKCQNDLLLFLKSYRTSAPTVRSLFGFELNFILLCVNLFSFCDLKFSKIFLKYVYAGNKNQLTINVYFCLSSLCSIYFPYICTTLFYAIGFLYIFKSGSVYPVAFLFFSPSILAIWGSL